MSDPLQQPPDPGECPWCHSKYAPRLYGWHERTEDERNVICRYAVRCLNCGARGPHKEMSLHAIEAWNRRAPAPAPTVPEDVADIIAIMADDWLERYSAGDSQWADAQVVRAWLDSLR